MTDALSKDTARFKIIKNWFKELTISELSVVMTTIDRELIKLIRAMYRTQKKYDAGKFIAKLDKCNSPREADRYEKVSGYNLLFVKSHVSHGPEGHFYSRNVRRKAEAADFLVKSVRFISVKTQEGGDGTDDDVNAFTLDSEIFVSMEFFLKMMKEIDNEFLIRDFACSKLVQPIEGSLLTG